MTVSHHCTMTVQTVFGTQKCQANPMGILYIQTYFKNDLKHGYGAEYLTRYERDYLEQFCQMN
ncbi:hypothetical protein [Photobacterium galatheae]|nr:hypothetical protein [Photobacterium galatheae]MCM0149199.1 hypothetical protein [Photobacterium galatheae]